MPRKSTPKTAVVPPQAQTIREAPEGLEKLCRGCATWWPADTEFFSSDAKSPDGLFYRCKACYRDWKATSPSKSNRPREELQLRPVALASVPWLGTQLPAPPITLELTAS